MQSQCFICALNADLHKFVKNVNSNMYCTFVHLLMCNALKYSETLTTHLTVTSGMTKRLI